MQEHEILSASIANSYHVVQVVTRIESFLEICRGYIGLHSRVLRAQAKRTNCNHIRPLIPKNCRTNKCVCTNELRYISFLIANDAGITSIRVGLVFHEGNTRVKLTIDRDVEP